MKQPHDTIIMSVCSPAKVPAHIAQANRSSDISDTQSQSQKRKYVVHRSKCDVFYSFKKLMRSN